MTKRQDPDEHIASTLHEADMGTPVAARCRKLGISEQTLYRGNKKYTGMGVADLRRLKQPEAEHRKLKQRVAELSRDTHMLPEASRTKR